MQKTKLFKIITCLWIHYNTVNVDAVWNGDKLLCILYILQYTVVVSFILQRLIRGQWKSSHYYMLELKFSAAYCHVSRFYD